LSPCSDRRVWGPLALLDATDEKYGKPKSALELGLARARAWNRMGNYVSHDLFEALMHDEKARIDFLETQLDLVAKLGPELKAQHHIGKLGNDKPLSPGGALLISRIVIDVCKASHRGLRLQKN
jgi:hypothetical protein